MKLLLPSLTAAAIALGVMFVSEFMMTKHGCIPDPNLLWGSQYDIVESRVDFDSSTAFAVVEWNLPWNAEADFGYWSQPVLPWIVYTDCFESAPDDEGQYLLKVDVVEILSGHDDDLEVGFDTANVGVWVDMFFDGGYISIDLGHTDQGNGTPNHLLLDVHIAQDDGTGNPVQCSIQTRRVEMIAYAGDDEFIVYDNMTGANGTNLTAHDPDKDYAGDGWPASTGTWELNGAGEAESDGAARYTIDAGTEDHEVAAEFQFYQQDAGLIGRYQDSSNYWQLEVTGLSSSDPSLKLIKVVAGSPTTVAEETYTGLGPVSNTTRLKMRLRFDGDDILGAIEFGWPLLAPAELTATDSALNTATEGGIFADGAGVQVNSFSVSDPIPCYGPTVWDTVPFTSSITDTGTVNVNIYFYETANGKTSNPYHSSCGYYNSSVVDNVDVIHYHATPFSSGDFLVYVEAVSGDTGDVLIQENGSGSDSFDTWLDLYRTNISIEAPVSGSKSAVIDVTVAVNDGLGSPVSGTGVTKRITLIATSTGP